MTTNTLRPISSSANNSAVRPGFNGRRLARLERYRWTSSAFGGATTTAEDPFAPIWSPGLLGRLQEPLSRYHE